MRMVDRDGNKYNVAKNKIVGYKMLDTFIIDNVTTHTIELHTHGSNVIQMDVTDKHLKEIDDTIQEIELIIVVKPTDWLKIVKPIEPIEPIDNFLTRLKNEKVQLDERIDRLTKYLVNLPSGTKGTTENNLLLEEQRLIMKQYSNILSKRLSILDNKEI